MSANDFMSKEIRGLTVGTLLTLLSGLTVLIGIYTDFRITNSHTQQDILDLKDEVILLEEKLLREHESIKYQFQVQLDDDKDRLDKKIEIRNYHAKEIHNIEIELEKLKTKIE